MKILFLLLSISFFEQTHSQTINWKGKLFNETSLSKKEYKDSLTKYDFGSVWTNTNNTLVYGFIGNNYQRIRIKIISATRDTNHIDTYKIIGKSMVKNNICQFTGTIKINSIRVNSPMPRNGCEDERFKTVKEQGVLFAEYHFTEDSTQKHSGVFDGQVQSSWYLNTKSKINYNDLEKCADSYCNNLFSGTWKEYISNTSIKKCNWGDYRIIDADSLDSGEGEFYPNDKYLINGWQTVRDAYWSNPPNNSARQSEEKDWWK